MDSAAQERNNGNGKSQASQSGCPTCSALQYSIDQIRKRLADLESSTSKQYRELRYSEIKDRILESTRIEASLKKARAEMKKHQNQRHRHEGDDL